MLEDYYEILGLSTSATEQEVKEAYRRLAKENHPDLWPNDKERERRFKIISNAYDEIKKAGFTCDGYDSHYNKENDNSDRRNNLSNIILAEIVIENLKQTISEFSILIHEEELSEREAQLYLMAVQCFNSSLNNFSNLLLKYKEMSLTSEQMKNMFLNAVSSFNSDWGHLKFDGLFFGHCFEDILFESQTPISSDSFAKNWKHFCRVEAEAEEIFHSSVYKLTGSDDEETMSYFLYRFKTLHGADLLGCKKTSDYVFTHKGRKTIERIASVIDYERRREQTYHESFEKARHYGNKASAIRHKLIKNMDKSYRTKHN